MLDQLTICKRQLFLNARTNFYLVVLQRAVKTGNASEVGGCETLGHSKGSKKDEVRLLENESNKRTGWPNAHWWSKGRATHSPSCFQISRDRHW